MAIEFNLELEDEFFLGEDKVVDFEIFGPDDVTPFNITGLALEWNLRKKDSSPDPALLTKTPSVIGTFNIDPGVNSQRARLTFASNDTDPLVTSQLVTPYTLKANTAYRHSMKLKDPGNETILSYGSWTFNQATER